MSAVSRRGSKQSKEKSKNDLPATYSQRDIVLGKVKGYPAWPAMIVDPGLVPATVQIERPTATKTTFYCVQFFPAGDYSWLAPKDISRLLPHEIESYLNEPAKKRQDLFAAYQVARDPNQWETEREEALAEAQVDELEDGEGNEEDGDEETKVGKKRKRAEKPKKATAEKSKKKKTVSPAEDDVMDADADGDADEDEAAKKKRARSTKAKKDSGKKRKSAKNKDMVESEDEDGAAGEATEKEERPSKKHKSQKSVKADDVAADGKMTENGEEKDPEADRVREWRHRLQKVFLSSKAPVRAEDMPQMHDIFTNIEQYDKMTVKYLQLSKIGKVMRHITALADDKIPRENEFRFRERASRLVDAWQIILNKSNEEARAKQVETPTDAMEVDKATEQAPETNGSDEHKRNGLTSPVAVDAANEEPADIAKTDVEAPELSAANADVTATVDEMDTTAENGIVAVTKPAIEETPAAADESMLTVGDVSMTETDAPAEFDPGAVGTE